MPVPEAALGVPLHMGLGLFLDLNGPSPVVLLPGHSAPGSAFLVLGFPERGEGVAMGINGNPGDRLMPEVVAILADEFSWPSGQYFK